MGQLESCEGPRSLNFDIIRKKSSASVLQGHLTGRSRKEETRLGLSRSLSEYHCAVDWFLRVVLRFVHLRPVHTCMVQSTARRHHQNRRKSMIYVVKGLDKIQKDDISRVSFIHDQPQHFLEHQQIVVTGPTGKETMTRR